MYDKLGLLAKIEKIYNGGGNIISYLKGDEKENQIEDILISYDFQAGSYVQLYKERGDFFSGTNNISRQLSDTIRALGISYESVLEAGVGEATTLLSFLMENQITNKRIYGFDIAWSRIKVANQFLNENGYSDVKLFVGDMFNIPMKDNSIDIVYTRQAMEPNGGKEKELLKEIYRVAKKYVILMEPAYELANEKAKRRMESHGYITGLLDAAKSLKYNVLDYKIMNKGCYNDLNPIAIMVIEKKISESDIYNPLCCPVTKTNLIESKDALFSKEAFLAYPILDHIPCLLKSNAIIATKFEP